MSYRRRLLHGKIDILRAELVARLQKTQGRSVLDSVDVDVADGDPHRQGRSARLMAHVYCPECGYNNPESAHFCAKCGAALVVPEEGEPTETFTAPRAGARASTRSRISGVHGAGAHRPLGRRPRGRDVRARGRARRRSGARRSARSSSTTSPSPASTPCFTKDGERWKLEDQGSLNGTFVNRERVETAELSDGDELQIGKYRLTFLAALMATTEAPSRRRLLTIGDGLQPAPGRVPGRLDLEDPLPRGSGPRSRPRRTQGGYRLFSEDDVERLETILRLQRDEFLPLRVIREELDGGRGQAAPPRGRSVVDAGEEELDLDELCERAGITPERARELEEFGLLEPRVEDGQRLYAESDADIAAACEALARFGIAAAEPARLPHGRRPRERACSRR